MLEEKYPNPPLHLDSPVLAQIEALMPKVLMPTMNPVLMPRVPRNILNPPSAAYFLRTRAERFGMPLDEFEKSEKGGDMAWASAEPGFQKLAELLTKNPDGPFFLGATVSYADFIVVAYFHFFKVLGDDIFDRLMAVDPSFPALYDACAQWFKRNNH